MVREKMKGKQDNTRRNVVLVFLFIVAIGGGAAFAFAVFGPSSAWEADVEISGVGYGNELFIDTAELEGMGAFVSARIVKVDFDGNPADGHSDFQTVTYERLGPLLDITGAVYAYDDLGMMPKVDFSVGQLFLSDALGNRVTDYSGDWEDVDDSTGQVHFYFGFSTAFTTRAIFWQCEDVNMDYWAVLGPKNADYLWIMEDGRIPDIGEVSLTTTIDLRVAGIGDYQYAGKIENVEVLGDPMARYTLSVESAGVPDTSIDAFNLAYDWKESYEVGMAESRNLDTPVQVTYDIIDSEAENMASITTGAKLRPGLDGNKRGQAGGGDPFIPVGPLSFEVGDITVYNVELIYNFLCDVTLNGIPLTAKGDWLSGRVDEYFIPPKDPEPLGFDLFWILVIGAIGVVCLSEGGKRRVGVDLRVNKGG